jgi:hypothetical protein
VFITQISFCLVSLCHLALCWSPEVHPKLTKSLRLFFLILPVTVHCWVQWGRECFHLICCTENSQCIAPVWSFYYSKAQPSEGQMWSKLNKGQNPPDFTWYYYKYLLTEELPNLPLLRLDQTYLFYIRFPWASVDAKAPWSRFIQVFTKIPLFF